MFLVFKVESGKKRPNQSAVKTPVPAKKAKPDTPQKIGESLVSPCLGEGLQALDGLFTFLFWNILVDVFMMFVSICEILYAFELLNDSMEQLAL